MDEHINRALWSEALLGGRILRGRLGWDKVSSADLDSIPRDLDDIRTNYADRTVRVHEDTESELRLMDGNR